MFIEKDFGNRKLSTTVHTNDCTLFCTRARVPRCSLRSSQRSHNNASMQELCASEGDGVVVVVVVGMSCGDEHRRARCKKGHIVCATFWKWVTWMTSTPIQKQSCMLRCPPQCCSTSNLLHLCAIDCVCCGSQRTIRVMCTTSIRGTCRSVAHGRTHQGLRAHTLTHKYYA